MSNLGRAVVDDSDLISLDEAAREFAMGKSTLLGWLAQKRLKRFKREGDRRTFVSRRELADLRRFRELE